MVRLPTWSAEKTYVVTGVSAGQLGRAGTLQFLLISMIHPGITYELAGQHLVRLVFIRQLASHAAILASCSSKNVHKVSFPD